MLNEEPRLSIISEGLNSLVTVDEFLMTTRQYSQYMPSSSDGPQTLRQVSKCSLEGPGGTLDDDLSVVSLSDKQDEDEDAVELTDVVIENVADNPDQSLFIDPFRLSKSQNLNIAEVM